MLVTFECRVDEKKSSTGNSAKNKSSAGYPAYTYANQTKNFPPLGKKIPTSRRHKLDAIYKFFAAFPFSAWDNFEMKKISTNVKKRKI